MSESNCVGDCGGKWCTDSMLAQVRRHKHKRLRAQGEEGDGTAMLQGFSEFDDDEEIGDEIETVSEVRGHEL